MDRHDNPNPLAGQARHAIDRRAALTGEPNSEQRDEMAESERAAEKAKDAAISAMFAMLNQLANKRDGRHVSGTAFETAMPWERRKLINGILAAARAAGIGGGNG